MKIKPNFELRKVAGEDVIVATGGSNIDFSKLIVLNSSASYLWQKAETMDHFSAETLAKMLTDKYDIDQDSALHDARSITERWIEVGVAEN